MFLPILIAIKIGASLFLCILIVQGYCRSPGIFCSIHLLAFSTAIDSLVAHHLHFIFLTKRQFKIIQATALFSFTALLITLFDWIQQSPH